MNPALLMAMLQLYESLPDKEKQRMVKQFFPAAKDGSTAHSGLSLISHFAGLQEAELGKLVQPGVNTCAADWKPLDEIRTDPARFQNRVNAFSEASAQAVAEFLDWNKMDPIVVWRDPADGNIYVLSGHSRYEGLRRRSEHVAPVRFYDGDETAAILFARADANRLQTTENLVEDLKAYVMMRDGLPSRGIPKATKTDLKRVFKNTWSKLESWSFLDPAGKFLAALASENRSEFPHVENRANWVGNLRKEYGPAFTNIHERDVFNFLYSDAKNLKIGKEEFDDLIRSRLARGGERIFPECNDDGCQKIRDWQEVGPNAQLYKQLAQLDKAIRIINERLRTNDPIMRAHTEAERAFIMRLGREFEAERDKLRKDLDIIEKEPGLFGLGGSETDAFFDVSDYLIDNLIAWVNALLDGQKFTTSTSKANPKIVYLHTRQRGNDVRVALYRNKNGFQIWQIRPPL